MIILTVHAHGQQLQKTDIYRARTECWNFRSRERKCHRTVVPGSENDVELSLPGAKKSWNFRCQSETALSYRKHKWELGRIH